MTSQNLGRLVNWHKLRVIPRRLRARNVTGLRFRSRIGLVAFGALLAALLPVNTAHAAQNDYGAIAYSESTAIASVGFAGNMDDAALAAVEQCRTQGGASDCAAYLWFQQGYAALARGSAGYFGTGWGTDAQYADTYAIQICQQRGGGDSCQVLFRAQTPGVADESPSATGGAFATPVRPTPSTPPPAPPASVSVPNLVGLSRDDAQRALPQGLGLGTVSGSDGTVVDQQPKAGDQVPPGTQVNLVLNTPSSPPWLDVLVVFIVGLALLVALVLRRRAERRRWHGRIRVESAPDLNPKIHLREPDRAASFTVRVEVHPDHGVQSVREVHR